MTTPDLRRPCHCERRPGIGPHWHSLTEGCPPEPVEPVVECQHGNPGYCDACNADDLPEAGDACNAVDYASRKPSPSLLRDLDEVFRGGADAVNHPSHYTSSAARCTCGESIECIQITEHMGFCLGNAVKYIWRADLKGDALEDLRKARWYVDRELARREQDAAGPEQGGAGAERPGRNTSTRDYPRGGVRPAMVDRVTNNGTA